MTNSPLVDFKRISPNKTSPRNHSIDTITIHCAVGQLSAGSMGAMFARPECKASANYGVGYDGNIGLYVDECDRSWCSSNAENDHRAITIEVACEPSYPYAVNDIAYSALLDLLVDICERNGIKKLVWSADKNERVNHLNGCNMTVHRDYANKSCPGDWLYERQIEIADIVNQRLQGSVWSKKEREWAVTNGLISGYGDGNYGWEDTVTREQLAVILKRFKDQFIKE